MTVTRLTQQWQANRQAFGERDLSASDYVYVWADGIHLCIRLREAKSCVLVRMAVRTDGTKELTTPPAIDRGCCALRGKARLVADHGYRRGGSGV
ncbi:hypothetical protein RKD20_000231 [Streptomyces sp. SLBN-8D4]